MQASVAMLLAFVATGESVALFEDADDFYQANFAWMAGEGESSVRSVGALGESGYDEGVHSFGYRWLGKLNPARNFRRADLGILFVISFSKAGEAGDGVLGKFSELNHGDLSRDGVVRNSENLIARA